MTANPARYWLRLPVLLLLASVMPGTAGPVVAQECQVRLERGPIFGKLDDPASVMSAQFAVMAEVPWGGWIVVEESNDVLHYDRNGDLAGQILASGDGPGELRGPAAVALDPTDSVWVSNLDRRAVVLGPDGSVGRTVISPSLEPIHGFTEEGMPYSGLSSYDLNTDPPTAAYFVRVWDRDGNVVGAYGRDPVATRNYREFTTMGGPEGSALGEAEFLYPARSEEGLVVRFHERGYSPHLPSSAVGEPIAVADAALKPVDVRVTDQGYFLIVHERVLDQSAERELAMQVNEVAGYSSPTMSARQRQPRVLNAVWDGRLVFVSLDGTVGVSAPLDVAPLGFASDSQVYGMVEDSASGLIQIVLFNGSTDCTVPN